MFLNRSPATPREAASIPAGSRRRAARRSPHEALTWRGDHASEPAQQVLRNTLRSACEVIGAQRGFILQTRDEPALEVVCAHHVSPRDLLDIVLGCAARALHQSLVHGGLGLADRLGLILPQLDGSFEENAPAVVAVPLELGCPQRGVMCLLRADPPRVLGELDIEILEALAEQAALALRAANQQSALSRLAASLHALSPQPA
ncbi:GAF domain-containing protein [Fontimonas sp. SYSU GA230001]|uniref:GAF domain-containing protein n=1 Tax=Fontimonas sp. SYSU GA230001 TaxID=3142450 RepID=UPI0032B470D0